MNNHKSARTVMVMVDEDGVDDEETYKEAKKRFEEFIETGTVEWKEQKTKSKHAFQKLI